MRRSAALLAGSLLLATAPMLNAKPLDIGRGNVRVGERLLREHCGMCHAIGRSGASPLAIAPPFRSLHERYPVEDLAEALAEGLVTGHPTMPEFRFDQDQVAHIIAYLKSLER